MCGLCARPVGIGAIAMAGMIGIYNQRKVIVQAFSLMGGKTIETSNSSETSNNSNTSGVKNTSIDLSM